MVIVFGVSVAEQVHYTLLLRRCVTTGRLLGYVVGSVGSVLSTMVSIATALSALGARVGGTYCRAVIVIFVHLDVYQRGCVLYSSGVGVCSDFSFVRR